MRRPHMNIKRTAGNINLQNDNERDSKRQRTGNCTRSIPSFSVFPKPKKVVLQPTRQYSVEIEGHGQMMYKDGWFRLEGRPRTDLGLNDGRFITNAKVIIRDPEGNQTFCGGGGTSQVIEFQMTKNNYGIKTVTVSLVQDSENGVYRFPAPTLEMKVRRNETVNVYGFGNVRVTAGEGGHVVHKGIGYVLVKGKVQSVSSHGTGRIRVDGNVDEGLSLGGATRVEIAGDVRGDIRLNGVCKLHVFGRHLGKGRMYKAWLANVRISEQDWGRDGEDNVYVTEEEEETKEKENVKTKEDNKKEKETTDDKEVKEMEADKKVKENVDDEKVKDTKKQSTDYDGFQEIKMDIMSDDEDDTHDFYS